MSICGHRDRDGEICEREVTVWWADKRSFAEIRENDWSFFFSCTECGERAVKHEKESWEKEQVHKPTLRLIPVDSNLNPLEPDGSPYRLHPCVEGCIPIQKIHRCPTAPVGKKMEEKT